MTDKRRKVLEVKDLRQHFRVGSGNRRIDIKAVDGISFDIYEGEVFGLVGESGCGKTTTGRTIIKLYKPTDGTVTYEGKIIGAGYSGNLRNIKKAKEKARLDIIKTNDRKYEIHKVKEEYKKLIEEKEEEIRNVNRLSNSEIEEINNYNIKIKDEIAAVKAEYLVKISDVKYDAILDIKEAKVSNKQVVDHDYKITVNAANKRLNQKISYLADAILTKEEKAEEKAEFLKEHELELIRIEDKYTKKLEKYNPIKFKKEREKILNKRIRFYENNEFSHELIFECKKELESLKDFQPVDVQELSSADKNKKIMEIKKREHKLIQALKKEEESKIEELKKQLKDNSEQKPLKDKIKENRNHQINELKKQIKSLKLERKEKINRINEDAKNNPNKYKVDNQRRKEIYQELRETIKFEKSEIKRLKRLNKIKETPEEKEARLLKVSHLEDMYEEKISKLENKINSITDKSSTEYQTLQADLHEMKIEREREILKANRENTYAGVMSNLQMIFQDPVASLNPRKTVKEIISEGLIIQGIRDKEYIDRKVAEALNLVGLVPEHAGRYPHEFSGGQRQRIGIARALIVNPKFIIADEPISALDVSIQAQIINLLKDLKDDLGLTILFIAHDLSVVKYFSDRIAVMYFGKIVELASAEELFANPLHPYTKSLLSAIPYPDPESEKTRQRVTYSPTIHDYSIDKPEMVEIKPGHFVYANTKEVEEYRRKLGEV